MVNVHGDGRTGFGHEGPHPSTVNFSVKGKNMGNFKGKLVGIKGVIWPTATGAHVEGYMDIAANGKWEKFGEYNGPCGKNEKSTKPVANQQIQFRVDNIEPDMKCAVISEIKPPL